MLGETIGAARITNSSLERGHVQGERFIRELSARSVGSNIAVSVEAQAGVAQECSSPLRSMPTPLCRPCPSRSVVPQHKPGTVRCRACALVEATEVGRSHALRHGAYRFRPVTPGTPWPPSTASRTRPSAIFSGLVSLDEIAVPERRSVETGRLTPGGYRHDRRGSARRHRRVSAGLTAPEGCHHR